MYITYHYLGEYPDDELKFVVIVSRYEGKWVFCRHKKRKTWEIPGGHIEKGESAHEAARRELYEETGALDFDLTPVNIYAVRSGEEKTLGMLCFAEIRSLDFCPRKRRWRRSVFLTICPTRSPMRQYSRIFSRMRRRFWNQSANVNEDELSAMAQNEALAPYSYLNEFLKEIK